MLLWGSNVTAFDYFNVDLDRSSALACSLYSLLLAERVEIQARVALSDRRTRLAAKTLASASCNQARRACPIAAPIVFAAVLAPRPAFHERGTKTMVCDVVPLAYWSFRLYGWPKCFLLICLPSSVVVAFLLLSSFS